MTRLIIDRAKWGRALNPPDSCAISQFRKQLGIDELVRFGQAFGYLAQPIMIANDDMPDGVEREQRIAELFAQAGVEVVYEGVYK